ncbi:hypothetical protein ACSQ67_016607 [Phaseolus vulgaris]
MPGFRAKIRIGILIIVVVGICLAALYGLLKPISNGCIMTYMYPTYIPISSSESISPVKYGLYLYHEGWKKIDFKEHLKKLSGVPVLFIPGNGGSFKQASLRYAHLLDKVSDLNLDSRVRSLAAESDRAYQNGPLERSFYQEASLRAEEGGVDINLSGFQLPSQYTSRLDWFAVDLEGEHSAMDGAILEEHTEYVVYAIHKPVHTNVLGREWLARLGEIRANFRDLTLKVSTREGIRVLRGEPTVSRTSASLQDEGQGFFLECKELVKEYDFQNKILKEIEKVLYSRNLGLTLTRR